MKMAIMAGAPAPSAACVPRIANTASPSASAQMSAFKRDVKNGCAIMAATAPARQIVTADGSLIHQTGNSPRRTSRIVPPPTPVTKAIMMTLKMSSSLRRAVSAPEIAKTNRPKMLSAAKTASVSIRPLGPDSKSIVDSAPGPALRQRLARPQALRLPVRRSRKKRQDWRCASAAPRVPSPRRRRFRVFLPRRRQG